MQFFSETLAAVGRAPQHHYPDVNVFDVRAYSTEIPTSISGALLSRLLRDINDTTNNSKLRLSSMALNEDRIRALATFSGSVDIILIECTLEDNAECRDAFVQCLVRNRGPFQLHRCHIDYPILAAALTGNSRVSTLKLEGNERITGHNADAVARKGTLLRALAHNCGLVRLDLVTHAMSNEHWTMLCHQSLHMHSTLTDLYLRMTGPFIDASINRARLSNKDKAHITGLLADIIKANTVLHTIRLDNNERDNQIYVDTILPHLEMNLYRQRVHAIRTAEIHIRRPLLGRALQSKSVRQNPNLLWMFMSGNPDIVL